MSLLGMYITKKEKKLKMEILKSIIQIVSLVVINIGVVMIYDARKISKKWFSFGDRNSSVKILKIIGFIIAIIGSLIIILN